MADETREMFHYPESYMDETDILNAKMYHDKLLALLQVRFRRVHLVLHLPLDSAGKLETDLLRRLIHNMVKEPALTIPNDLLRMIHLQLPQDITYLMPEDLGSQLLVHDVAFQKEDESGNPDEISALVTKSCALQDQLKPRALQIEKDLGTEFLSGFPDSYYPIVFEHSHWANLLDEDWCWARQDCTGTTVLHFILEHLEDKHLKVVRGSRRTQFIQKLTDVGWLSKHPADRLGRTLLHVAAKHNLPDVAVVLTSARMDPNATTWAGGTALHYAAALGHLDICRTLLAGFGLHHTNRNPKDTFGCTPLEYATINGHEAVIRLLLQDREVDVNYIGEDGKTALTFALERGPSDTIYEMFLEHPHTNFDLTDHLDRTLLHHAVLSGNESAVQNLLEKCADVINVPDVDGMTALSYAADQQPHARAARIVRILLQVHSIDASMKDDRHQTALYHAAESGNLEVCRLLGVRVDSRMFDRCDNDKTPLDCAEENGFTEVATLLRDFQARFLDMMPPIRANARQGFSLPLP